MSINRQLLMRKFMPWFCMLPFIISANGVSAAQSAPNTEIWIEGFGGETCARYAQQFSPDQTEATDRAFIWLTGFVSGMNLVASANNHAQFNVTLPGNSIQLQLQYLRDYCDLHPLRQVVDAATSMVLDALKNNGLIQGLGGPSDSQP